MILKHVEYRDYSITIRRTEEQKEEILESRPYEASVPLTKPDDKTEHKTVELETKVGNYGFGISIKKSW